MTNLFFDKPILNSPYVCPRRHWELDKNGQPTQQILASRRRAEFITPIPQPRKRKGAAKQEALAFNEGKGLSTQAQQYDHQAVINSVRHEVDKWRTLPNPADWRVAPETARLLQHWRHHPFSGVRPFFCQVEAVETAIWLTEVAPQLGKVGRTFLDHLEDANRAANPGLERLALKLATGAGKTTVMAMLIAWQTVNAVRRPTSRRFTRAFGTQLLCEQVIGRALRRQSYELNAEGLFNFEYADVLGIPFDFNAEPVVAPPQKPRETIQVKALREREALEIRFLRVQGYRVELPATIIPVEFSDDSRMELTPALVGATETRQSGIIGEQVDLNLVHTGDVRPSQVVYELTSHLLLTRFRDAHGQPHRYRPDFIVRVDDGHGGDDLLNLVVEIKGYRGEDAKIKKETMLTHWVPGVNRLGTHGRWAFTEFTDVWQMQDDFAEQVQRAFDAMLEQHVQRETA